MNKWTIGTAVAAVAALVIGSATGFQAHETTGAARTAKTQDLYQQIKASGVIKFGTEGTYAPFDFHDANNKLTGFDVAIATEVAKRLGVKAQFVEGPWDGLFAGLNDKRFDVLADEVTIRPDRLAKYDFSTPYIASDAVLIVRKDNKTIHSFKDLKGKTAAESLTSNLGKIARDNGAKIDGINGFNDAVSLLEAGRVDATVNDKLSFLDLMKHNPNAPLKVVASYGSAEQNGLVVRKGNQDLVQAIDKALASMKKDGTYLKISKKWFNADVSH